MVWCGCLFLKGDSLFLSHRLGPWANIFYSNFGAGHIKEGMWNSSNYLTSFFQKTSSTPTSADHYHVLWQTSRGISNSFHKNVLLDGAREHKWTKNGLGILKTHVMQLKRNFLWLLWPEKKSASTGQPKTQFALCTGGQWMQVDQKPC